MLITSKTLKLAKGLASLLFLISCAKKSLSSGDEVRVNTRADKIVGGQEVDSSKLVNNLFVMIVSDNNGIPQVCTGTFISTHHILTAAHCVGKNIDDLSLVGGVNPLSDDKSGSYTPIKIIKHDRYDDSSINDRNDLAIIQIVEESKLSSSELPKLPDQELMLKIQDFKNFRFKAFGYGKTGSTEKSVRSEGILRSVQLKAEDVNSHTFKVNQINSHGVCYGDSGGPALMNVNKKLYIIGIASGIFNKGNSQSIDECQGGSLYMNLASQLEWITKNSND